MAARCAAPCYPTENIFVIIVIPDSRRYSDALTFAHYCATDTGIYDSLIDQEEIWYSQYPCGGNDATRIEAIQFCQ